METPQNTPNTPTLASTVGVEAKRTAAVVLVKIGWILLGLIFFPLGLYLLYRKITGPGGLFAEPTPPKVVVDQKIELKKVENPYAPPIKDLRGIIEAEEDILGNLGQKPPK